MTRQALWRLAALLSLALGALFLLPWISIDEATVSTLVETRLDLGLPLTIEPVAPVEIAPWQIAWAPLDPAAAIASIGEGRFRGIEPPLMELGATAIASLAEQRPELSYAWAIWLTPLGAALTVLLWLAGGRLFLLPFLAALPPIGLYAGAVTQTHWAAALLTESLTPAFYGALGVSILLVLLALLSPLARR